MNEVEVDAWEQCHHLATDARLPSGEVRARIAALAVRRLLAARFRAPDLAHALADLGVREITLTLGSETITFPIHDEDGPSGG